MSSNETMFPFAPGQAHLRVSADFIVGYNSGYEAAQPGKEQVLTDQDISDFLAKHINDVHESGAHNAGYITGYIASLTEIVAGDCLMYRPQSFPVVTNQQDWQVYTNEQRAAPDEESVYIPLAELRGGDLALLPDLLFRTLFLSQAREEALTPEKWEVLTAHLRNVWLAQKELSVRGVTTRTIEARLLPESLLKELVYIHADRWTEAAKQQVDWGALTWEQSHALHNKHYEQAKAHAMQHPVAQELGRRGVRHYEWDETQ